MSGFHVLKTDLRPFAAVWAGRKTCELRFNDRDFRVSDVLRLEETNGVPTGRSILLLVTHIQDGYGLPKDTVAMSTKLLARLDEA